MKSRIGSAIATVTLLMAFGAAAATGTNNDDSCDISTTPAATLLLPYFEVDLNSPMTTAQTTLFTVQSINLYDIFGPAGVVASRAGTTSDVRPGERSLPNSANSHFAPGAMRLCARRFLQSGRAYSTASASQNWVTVSMSSEGRFSFEFDAAPLVNGCTPARPKGATIGSKP
jgi:hypothetical protein